MILLSYKIGLMRFFGDGEWEQPVDLILEKKTWFGFGTKEVKQKFIISMFGDLGKHYKHWDKLIKSKELIKL